MHRLFIIKRQWNKHTAQYAQVGISACSDCRIVVRRSHPRLKYIAGWMKKSLLFGKKQDSLNAGWLALSWL